MANKKASALQIAIWATLSRDISISTHLAKKEISLIHILRSWFRWVMLLLPKLKKEMATQMRMKTVIHKRRSKQSRLNWSISKTMTTFLKSRWACKLRSTMKIANSLWASISKVPMQLSVQTKSWCMPRSRTLTTSVLSNQWHALWISTSPNTFYQKTT